MKIESCPGGYTREINRIEQIIQEELNRNEPPKVDAAVLSSRAQAINETSLALRQAPFSAFNLLLYRAEQLGIHFTFQTNSGG